VRPAICLLPGLLCDATIWTHQREAFSPVADVLIPDFRAVDSISAMARIVLDSAPELFLLAGHSLGGRIALEVVRMASERVQRLALLDTGVHPRASGEETKRQALIDIARNESMAAMCARWLPPMVYSPNARVLPALTEMVLRSTPESFANQQRALLDRPDPRADLARIQCPTLVLCGREDQWSPVKQHEEIAAAIPHSTLVIIDNAGHMAPFEQPEAVTAALLEWSGLSNLQDQTL
jgi:pimeloyl-ACP methyl ester carboxylesterase